MRVLVMGAGGIGAYYGALLERQGHDVTYVARGAHLAAMRERGLEVRDRGETTVLKPVKAVGTPAEAGGTFDLILFAVKTYDVEGAATAIKPTRTPGTC